jgi:Skp family chaperone for outer membrane proteins
VKKRKPRIISKEELEKKNTKELLGYLKRLQQCEESFTASDMDVNLDLTEKEVIYFKQTVKWRNAYDRVKSILNKREHIENKKASH